MSSLADNALGRARAQPDPVPRDTLVINGDSLQALGQDTAFGYLARGPWNWALARLGQRLRLLANAAVSGQTSVQMMTTYDADIIARRPAWVFVCIGTNDITQGLSYLQLQANILDLINRNRRIGARTILGTVPPKNSDVTATAQQRAQYNRWLKSLRSTERGVYVIDTAARVTDPATGQYVTGYSWDGVHYALPGAVLAGEAIYETLDPLVPWLDVLPCGPFDTNNRLSNAGMSGDTSGVATSWTSSTVSGSAHTPSKVARADGVPGDWQRFVVTAPGSGDGPRLSQTVNVGSGQPFAVGDPVQALIEFRAPAADWSTVSHLRLVVMAYNGDFSVDQRLYALLRNTADAWPTIAGVPYRPEYGVLATPLSGLVIPAGATKVEIRAEFKGVGTIDWGRAGLISVTA